MEVMTEQRVHRRPLCVGCQRPCGPDEGYRTAAGFVHVHGDCLERRRPMWMKAGTA